MSEIDKIKLQVQNALEERVNEKLLAIYKEEGINPYRHWTTHDQRRLKIYIAKGFTIEQIAIRFKRDYFDIKQKATAFIKYFPDELTELQYQLKTGKGLIKEIKKILKEID